MRPAKIPIRLRIRIVGCQGCKVSSCGQRRLIGLRRSAEWLESSLDAHDRRYDFSRYDSNDIQCCLFSINTILEGAYFAVKLKGSHKNCFPCEKKKKS